MHEDITAIILAGGKSSRMGSDKALLQIGGRTVIEGVVGLLQSLFPEILLSVNSPLAYEFLHLPLVQDVYRSAGPLAGIHAALRESANEKNLIISCDLPLMSREMIDVVASRPTDKALLIVRAAGYLQPFPGLYRRSLLPLLEDLLREPAGLQGVGRRRHAIHALYDRVEIEIIEAGDLPLYRAELFFNLNNQNDYQAILNRPASLSLGST